MEHSPSFMSPKLEASLALVELARRMEEREMDEAIKEEKKRVELKLAKAFNRKPLHMTHDEVDDFCEALKKRMKEVPELRIGQFLVACLPEGLPVFYVGN